MASGTPPAVGGEWEDVAPDQWEDVSAPAKAPGPAHGGVDHARRAALEENLVQIDPRLSGAAHVNDVAAGLALPVAAAGASAPYILPTLLRAAASPVTSAAIGGYQGFKRGGLMGAVEGAALGAATNKFLGIGGGKLIDWANRIRALRALGSVAPAAAKAVPAVVEAAAPAVETAVPAAAATADEAALLAQAAKQYAKDPAMLAVIKQNLGNVAPAAAESAAAPAALSKAEAAAKLESLLGNAVKEGKLAAATKEAAKGNRQLAEKILGDLQGEGVVAP